MMGLTFLWLKIQEKRMTRNKISVTAKISEIYLISLNEKADAVELID